MAGIAHRASDMAKAQLLIEGNSAIQGGGGFQITMAETRRITCAIALLSAGVIGRTRMASAEVVDMVMIRMVINKGTMD